MTKEATKFSQKTRGEIPLGNGNKIVISVVYSPKHPQKYLDVRLHSNVEHGYKGPTKKGIRISAEDMPYFVKTINNLLEEVTEGKFK